MRESRTSEGIWHHVHEAHANDAVITVALEDVVIEGRVTAITRTTFTMGELLRIPFEDVEEVVDGSRTRGVS